MAKEPRCGNVLRPKFSVVSASSLSSEKTFRFWKTPSPKERVVSAGACFAVKERNRVKVSEANDKALSAAQSLTRKEPDFFVKEWASTAKDRSADRPTRFTVPVCLKAEEPIFTVFSEGRPLSSKEANCAKAPSSIVSVSRLRHSFSWKAPAACEKEEAPTVTLRRLSRRWSAKDAALRKQLDWMAMVSSFVAPCRSSTVKPEKALEFRVSEVSEEQPMMWSSPLLCEKHPEPTVKEVIRFRSVSDTVCPARKHCAEMNTEASEGRLDSFSVVKDAKAPVSRVSSVSAEQSMTEKEPSAAEKAFAPKEAVCSAFSPTSVTSLLFWKQPLPTRTVWRYFMPFSTNALAARGKELSPIEMEASLSS